MPHGTADIVRASDVFAAMHGASTVIPMTWDGEHPSFAGILALAGKTTMTFPPPGRAADAPSSSGGRGVFFVLGR
ncbi:hypothetical protein AS032_17365 [Rhodococcus qingshengii]|nr:hypothetical protein AS032_17365 [Rhodococcus qingshengii]